MDSTVLTCERELMQPYRKLTLIKLLSNPLTFFPLGSYKDNLPSVTIHTHPTNFCLYFQMGFTCLFFTFHLVTASSQHSHEQHHPCGEQSTGQARKPCLKEELLVVWLREQKACQRWLCCSLWKWCMVASKAVFPRGWETVHEKWDDGTWRFSWGSLQAHAGKVYTSLGQRIFSIVSIDHRLWSSVYTFSWALNKGPPQLSYWKVCRHSRGPHLRSNPQMRPHHSLTHCSLFAVPFLTLGVQHWARQSVSTWIPRIFLKLLLLLLRAVPSIKGRRLSYPVLIEVLCNRCKINGEKTKW